MSLSVPGCRRCTVILYTLQAVWREVAILTTPALKNRFSPADRLPVARPPRVLVASRHTTAGANVIQLRREMRAFELTVLAQLRTAQLMRGCAGGTGRKIIVDTSGGWGPS